MFKYLLVSGIKVQQSLQKRLKSSLLSIETDDLLQCTLCVVNVVSVFCHPLGLYFTFIFLLKLGHYLYPYMTPQYNCITMPICCATGDAIHPWLQKHAVTANMWPRSVC